MVNFQNEMFVFSRAFASTHFQQKMSTKFHQSHCSIEASESTLNFPPCPTINTQLVLKSLPSLICLRNMSLPNPPPAKKKHETHSLASYWPSIVGDRHVVRKHNVGLSSFSHLFVASRPCFGNIVHNVGADCWHHVGHGHGGSPKFPGRAKSGELYCTCSLRQTGKQKRTKLQNEVKANIFFVHPTQTERNSHQQDFCWFFSDWGSRPYISYNKHAFATVTGLGGYQSMQIQLIPLKWS